MKQVMEPPGIDADFAMIYKGNSMIIERIFDGDIVYIKQQDELIAGEMAVVRYNEKVVMGRVRFGPGCIILGPANPVYAPFVIEEDNMENVDVLGKVVAFTGRI